GAERFADYSQWEEWSRERKAASRKQESAAESASGNRNPLDAPAGAAAKPVAAKAKKKVWDKKNREIETIEKRLAEDEAELKKKHDSLLDPAVMSDGVRLHAVSLDLDAAQKRIDELYARWVELEDKLK